MTDKELLKQALEALEGADQIDIDMRDAIVSLKARLKQAEKQKPVAWLHRMDNTEGIKSNGKGIVLIDQYRRQPFGLVGVDFDESYPITSTPLYTVAQQHKPWVSLNAKEVEKIVDDNTQDDQGYDIWCNGRDVAAIVEAKLKEKNT